MSEPTRIPVDRVAALVRAAWRALLALLIGGAARQLYQVIDWSLMWRTDAASCAALVAVMALLIVPLVLLVFSLTRWLLLACWPAPACVTWTDREATLRLGPFGTITLDRTNAVVDGPPAGIPDRLADELPLSVRHRALSGNAADMVMHFTRINMAQMRDVLVRHDWLVPVVDGDDEP